MSTWEVKGKVAIVTGAGSGGCPILVAVVLNR